jgi:chemotaxis protein MotB
VKNELREKPVIVVVKKKRRHGGHHGGAWKVAFADFMTSLMALFLVLWIVGQSSDVKSAIAGHFKDPLGRADQFGNSIMPGAGAARPMLTEPLSIQDIVDPRIDRLRRLANFVKDRLTEVPNFEAIRRQVEVELTEEGLRITLLEDSAGVFFELGSPAPHAAGRTLLRSLGEDLSRVPNQVAIEGHTDARPYSGRTRYSNWELSADRANAARRLLVDGGLRDEQVMEVRGLAATRLRMPQDPYAPENRRVTITVLLGPEVLKTLSMPEGVRAPIPPGPASAAGTGGSP